MLAHIYGLFRKITITKLNISEIFLPQTSYKENPNHLGVHWYKVYAVRRATLGVSNFLKCLCRVCRKSL